MAARLKRKELITSKRQEQILKAALVVFSRKGFGQATVADIAQEAGISVGTIYNYYKDKHDLLLSLITHNLILGNIGKIISDSAASTRSGDKFITAIVEDRLKIGFTNAHKMFFLFFEMQRSTKLRRHYSKNIVTPLLNGLECFIKDQISKGDFRQFDEAISARALVGMIIGVMILSRLEGKSSPFRIARVQEISAELSKLMLYGFKLARQPEDTAAGRKQPC